MHEQQRQLRKSSLTSLYIVRHYYLSRHMENGRVLLTRGVQIQTSPISTTYCAAFLRIHQATLHIVTTMRRPAGTGSLLYGLPSQVHLKQTKMVAEMMLNSAESSERIEIAPIPQGKYAQHGTNGIVPRITKCTGVEDVQPPCHNQSSSSRKLLRTDQSRRTSYRLFQPEACRDTIVAQKWRHHTG